MNLPNELKFIERPIRFFKFEVNAESMLRCVLWTLLFLGLAHFHAPKIIPQLPYAKEMQAQNLIPLSSATSDPKWARLDYKALPENSIAWVAGSSLAINPKEDGEYVFLPSQIHTDARQFLSIKMARRMLDTYTMVKDIIARKPSKMVVVLNPFWDLQDTSAFYKTNLMNAGIINWLNKDDWMLAPLLCSPGNLLWGAVGHRHNLIVNSYDILKTVQLKYAPPKAKKIKTEKAEKTSYDQPTLFWIMNRHRDNEDFSSFDAKAWQSEVMGNNNIGQSAWGQKLLRQMFVAIKESNIPTLIYIAPVDPMIEKTPAREAYRGVITQIGLIAAEYESDNISFVRVPAPVVNSMDYIDYLHVSDSGQLPSYLSHEITKLKATP